MTMAVSFFALHYSFVCPQGGCNDQFEVLLGDLVMAERVACPRCATEIDIRQSKTDGDLAQIFNQVASQSSNTPDRRRISDGRRRGSKRKIP
jgi:hypothetical protein